MLELIWGNYDRLTFYLVIEIGPVRNFEIVEQSGNLVASWEHYHENCQINITVGERFHVSQDVPEGSQVLDSTSFPYCISNEVRAYFVSGSGQTGDVINYTYRRGNKYAQYTYNSILYI